MLQNPPVKLILEFLMRPLPLLIFVLYIISVSILTQASSLQVAPPLSEYPLSGPLETVGPLNSVDPLALDSVAPLTLGLAGDHQKLNASLAAQVCRSWLQQMHGQTEGKVCSICV